MRRALLVCSLLLAHTAFAHNDHDPRGRSCASYVRTVQDTNFNMPGDLIRGMTTLGGSLASMAEYGPLHRLNLDKDADAITAYFAAIRPKP